MIPKGHTPNLLFTLVDPRDCDKDGLPLGPVVVVHCRDMYTLVRDLLMEQQTMMAQHRSPSNGLKDLIDAIEGATEPEPMFDIEAFYNGPVKIPPHDKESDSGPSNNKKDSPKKRDG